MCGTLQHNEAGGHAMGGHCERRGRTKDNRAHTHGSDSDREHLFDDQLLSAGGTTHGHALRSGHAETPSVLYRPAQQRAENRDDGHGNGVPERKRPTRVRQTQQHVGGGVDRPFQEGCGGEGPANGDTKKQRVRSVN